MSHSIMELWTVKEKLEFILEDGVTSISVMHGCGGILLSNKISINELLRYLPDSFLSQCYAGIIDYQVTDDSIKWYMFI